MNQQNKPDIKIADIKIAVIGTGSWGTAIANLLAKKQKVTIFGRNNSAIDEINQIRSNQKYLPDIRLSSNITGTTNYALIKDFDLIFIAVPVASFYETLESLSQHLLPEIKQNSIVICSKGITNEESGNPLFLSEIVQAKIPKANLAILSGPNFALEVALDKFTITTIASNNSEFANKVATILNQQNFCCEVSDQPLSCELFATIKNILAIACGIIDGMNLGENFKAGAVACGMKEIAKISAIFFPRQEDVKLPLKSNDLNNNNIFSIFSAGFGDVFLTCSSTTSRNYLLGKNIANFGLKTSLYQESRQFVNFNSHCEGINSTKQLLNLLQIRYLNIDFSIETPLISTVNRIIDNQISNEQIIEQLTNAVKKDFSEK
jgi:glycerol-3-phosphate dehydrogenase (NAD(P)+)